MTLSEQTDQQLMTAVQQGDATAFEELYRRYARPLHNFFFRMIWDPSRSEDLMQEVFVKLWTRAAQFRAESKFSTYLFQIARNHWLHAQDKLARRPREYSLEKTEKKKRLASVPPGKPLAARLVTMPS